MKNTLAILSLFSALLPALSASAAEIINVLPFRTGQVVVVEYDLVSDTPVIVNVNISVLGVTYNQDQLSLEGDVGRQVLPGKTRKFTWDVKRDFPTWQGLEFSVHGQARQLR